MSGMPAVDMQPAHWAIVQQVLRQHVPGLEVWAFGSRARGTAKPYSDLDLAVVAGAPLPLEILANLADAFSASDLPWKVDVVDWATAGENFQRIIERDRVVLQESGAG